MATKVYGQSDDLLEFDGDVRGEVGCYGSSDASEPNAAAIFSDGTITEWTYDKDGIWRCKVLAKGSAFDRVDICVGDGKDDYSDVLHLSDGVKRAWAAKGALERVMRRMSAADEALAAYDLSGPAGGALVGQTAPTESTGTSLRDELTEVIRWRFKSADGEPMNGPLILEQAREIADAIAPMIEEATGEL